MSPGWQSSTSQMASRVEKRMALIFPVLILERLTLEMPTCSARWLREIFLSAMTRSRRKMIGMFSPLSYSVSSAWVCSTTPYWKTSARI